MVPVILSIVMSLVLTSSAWATVRFVDPTTTSCSTPSDTDYDPGTETCGSGTDLVYSTPATASAAAVAGDVIYWRTEVYSTTIGTGGGRHIIPLPIGTAAAYVTQECYPGDVCEIRPPDTTYPLQRGATRKYAKVKGFYINGVNTVGEFGIFHNQGESFITIEGNEIANFHDTGIFLNGPGWVIRNNYIHDLTSLTCAGGTGFYGVYYNAGNDGLIEGNLIERTPGGGIQTYPNNTQRVVIRRNIIRDVGKSCPNSDAFGVVLSNTTNTEVYDNTIYDMGVAGVGTGTAVGIRVKSNVTNAKLHNNTVYDIKSFGVYVDSASAVGTQIQNSLIVSNGTNILNSGTGTVQTTNRTTGAIDDCTVSTTDLRMRTGTNPCRGTGTASSLRGSPVDTIDIGAYEQGKVASVVALVDGGLEVTVSVMTPGVLPVSGITGGSVTCVGCTGTPVIGNGTVKAGSNNVIIFPLTGLSSSGTCTFTLGATNATDSLLIGGPNGTAQGLNTVTAQAVTGTCANSGAGSAPTDMIAHYKFNASTGNDETVNNNDGTVSSGITFSAGFEGLEAVFPTDATYRHVAYPVGASTNLGTTSVTWCGVVTPDLTYTQKVVFSSGSNGTNQRFYVGWYTVSGQKQWGIGVGSSGMFGGSEFPIVAQPTMVCLINNAATDTVTLWINRVKGTGTESVKTHSGHTTTATNFRIGNDGTFTTNNGGFTVDEPHLWDRALSDVEVEALYDSLFAVSAGLPCYAQSHVQYEGVYLSNGSPWIFTPSGSGIDVPANGGVAIKFQITCTGSAGSQISVAPYYSTDGVNFNLRIPADGASLRMWGDDVSAGLNRGVSTGCINASGLTANDGSTVLTAVTSPTFALAQNHCTSYRIFVRVGATATPIPVFYIQFRQDNGEALVGGYAATARINVVNPRASGIVN